MYKVTSLRTRKKIGRDFVLGYYGDDALGSYADLRIASMALESSGNFATITHQKIFQEKHRAIVERDFNGEVTTTEVYQARLGDLVTRLELSGSTIQAIERRFSKP